MHNRFHLNPDTPFTAEDLKHLCLDINSSVIVAIDARDLENKHGVQVAPIGISEALHPKAHNLLLAAPFMYRKLCQVYEVLELMHLDIEGFKAFAAKQGLHQWKLGDRLEAAIVGMQEEIITTTRTAIEGPEKVAEQIVKGVDI